MEIAIKPSRNSLILRSVINILFGVLILIYPGISLLILAIAFSINILITGLFMIFEPAFDKENKHAFLTILIGLFGVGAGVYLLSRPLTSVVVLSLIIAAWAIFYGIVDLFIGFKLSEAKAGASWVFLIIGILSIIFGIYLAFNPLEGSLALVWVVGVYSIAIGLVLAFNALSSKNTDKQIVIKKPASKSKKAKK